MQEKRDLFDLSTELRGVSMVLTGLGNQLDNDQSDTLNPGAMKDALFSVQVHLERIAEDLEHLDSIEAEKKGAKNEN